MSSNPLGDELRRLREKRGQNQLAFANDIGVPPSTINRAESGLSIPSDTTLRKVETSCGLLAGSLVEIARVFKKEGEKSKNDLNMGFPNDIISTPLIAMLFNFTASFNLRGSHFFALSEGAPMAPQYQIHQKTRFDKEKHTGFTGGSLIDALAKDVLDCAWLPRPTYLQFRASLQRYATLGPSSLEADSAPANAGMLRAPLDFVKHSDAPPLNAKWLVRMFLLVDKHLRLVNPLVEKAMRGMVREAATARDEAWLGGPMETVAECLNLPQEDIEGELQTRVGRFELTLTPELLATLDV